MIALALAMSAALASAPSQQGNGYPTSTSVDYVIGCMAANGQTQDMMGRCACSIDVIASILPYALYERAEVTLRMRSVAGEAASLFRQAPMLKAAVDRLREAQIEADFRCF